MRLSGRGAAGDFATCSARVRSVGGGEKRRRDGHVGVPGADDAQISVWVFTIYDELRLCGDPRGPARASQGRRLRTELGLSRDFLSANRPPSLASPLRPASKTYVLQLMDPTFANELVGLKLFSFKALERAMGIEPTTYSLGSCRSTTELRPRTLVIFDSFGPVPHPKRGHRNRRAALATSGRDTPDWCIILLGATMRMWTRADARRHHPAAGRRRATRPPTCRQFFTTGEARNDRAQRHITRGSALPISVLAPGSLNRWPRHKAV